MVVLFQVTEDKHLKICVECFACKHVCAPHVYGAHRSQKRVSELLEVELQMVVGAVWVMGIDPGSFTRAAVWTLK